MSDIEKDIKFIEKMIKEYKTFGDLHNPDYEDTERIYKALENILSAYRNSIPKQKVKDILQKNRNELFSITYLDPKQYEPYEKQIERINKIETELLEGE